MIDNPANASAAKPASFLSKRWGIFLAVGGLSSLLLAWLLVNYPADFNNPGTLYGMAALLACTLLLLWAIPNPIPSDYAPIPFRRGRFILLLLVISIPLFILPVIFRSGILFALPVLAGVVLILLRRTITRREWIYAGLLALAACAAGLSAGWITDLSPQVWAGLQLALVFTSFLAGWKIFQAAGVAQYHVGYSRLLSEGWQSALRGFGFGMLVALPWALGNIQLGGAKDTWLTAWWQPLVALQPAIAEEAWGRTLMVALLFMVFRLAARPRVAFAAALILAGYWFAYLHTPMGLEGLFSTLLLGTLYALPVSYLCLYRDLETAIGWHFCVDFLRFLFAYLL